MQTRNILLFNPVGKNAKVSVFFQDGTFWLTQKAMADLFGVKVPAVSKHFKNIFETGELDIKSTISILETVQKEASGRDPLAIQNSSVVIYANMIVGVFRAIINIVRKKD